jgi:DNA-binding response OmpR family regulator
MDLRGKTGLLIDDVAEMRNAVRIQLADAGIQSCDSVRNVKEAVVKLTARRYDLVVCDYNLGQGADGQQLLELVRRNKLLPLTTAFLMITGETGYEQVSTAAEFAPDDYLLKPFTSDVLATRLSRILDKKEALAPIYKHMGAKGDKALALAACDQVLAEQPRYATDVLRLKGDLLLALNRIDEADALYESVLQQRATPWAAVGKARALAASGKEDEAKVGLQQALAAYPNYLAAYDSLAGLLQKTDKAAAQQIVEQALKVAPSTRRQRQLGSLALENKDFSRAEEAYKRTVEKDRTGFFKSFDDYAGLAKSCAEQGKTQEALAAVKDMSVHFTRTPELAAHQAATEAEVQLKAGNTAAAQAALETALTVSKDANLAPETALAVAQACFASGRSNEAKAIIQAVAEDHHENDEVLAQAQSVFSAAGMESEGAVFLEATRKRMVKLNNDAVAMAKAGQLDEAVTMLAEAADRLTNNCQVAVNAALAVLMQAQKQGPTPEHFAQALRYILQARKVNADHPRLGEVIAFYRKLAPPGTPFIPEE